MPSRLACAAQVDTLSSGEIDYDDLRKHLLANKDKPAILNVNIGTTVKGAVDDLDKVGMRGAGLSGRWACRALGMQGAGHAGRWARGWWSGWMDGWTMEWVDGGMDDS